MVIQKKVGAASNTKTPDMKQKVPKTMFDVGSDSDDDDDIDDMDSDEMDSDFDMGDGSSDEQGPSKKKNAAKTPKSSGKKDMHVSFQLPTNKVSTPASGKQKMPLTPMPGRKQAAENMQGQGKRLQEFKGMKSTPNSSFGGKQDAKKGGKQGKMQQKATMEDSDDDDDDDEDDDDESDSGDDMQLMSGASKKGKMAMKQTPQKAGKEGSVSQKTPNKGNQTPGSAKKNQDQRTPAKQKGQDKKMQQRLDMQESSDDDDDDDDESDSDDRLMTNIRQNKNMTKKQTPNKEIQKAGKGATPQQKGPGQKTPATQQKGHAKMQVDEEEEDDDDDDDDEDDSGDDLDSAEEEQLRRQVLGITNKGLPKGIQNAMQKDGKTLSKGQDSATKGKGPLTPAQLKKSQNKRQMQNDSDEEEDDDDDEDDDDEEDSEDDVPSPLKAQQKKPQKQLQKTNQNPVKMQQEKGKEQKTKQNQMAKQQQQSPVKGQTNAESPSKFYDSAARNIEEQRRRDRDVKTLFIKDFPPDATEEELKRLSPDIVQVRVIKSHKNKLPIAFLEFANEKKTEENLEIIQSKKVRGKQIFVDFSGEKSKNRPQQKKQQQDARVINPKKLYVTGMTHHATLADVAALFPESVAVNYNKGPLNVHATILFATDEEASEAFKRNANAKLGGKALTVLFSLERSNTNKRKQKRKQQSGPPGKRPRQDMKPPSKPESDDDDDDDDESD